MSTQSIKDYLVKQLFIEKNIVTYRSLSRHFNIHVNVAKRELAAYHEQAPYDSQTSFATYLLTGEMSNPRNRSHGSQGKRKQDNSMDVDDEDDVGMDMFVPTQTDSGEDNEDDEEEELDYEDVPTISITIVNEKDLEDAKSKYYKLGSVHVYSLSPSPVHDASHLSSPTPELRKKDNSKGPEYSETVGRVVAPNISVKPIKMTATPQPAKAGSSSKASSSKDVAASAKGTPAPPAASSTKSTTATAAPATKAQADKKPAAPAPKKTGKLDFFGASSKKKSEDKVPVKKEEEEEPPKEEKKPAKVFFGAAAPSKPKEKAKEKEKEVKPVVTKKEEPKVKDESARGTKRKSTALMIDSDSEGEVTPKSKKASVESKSASRVSSRAPSLAPSRPPSSVAGSISQASSRRSSLNSTALNLDDEEEEEEVKPSRKAVVASKVKVKKGVVVSDDEDDDAPVKLAPAKGRSRKEEVARKAMLLDQEEAKNLMDMDDDKVDRVMRKNARHNPVNIDSDEDEVDEDVPPKTKSAKEDRDGDVSMGAESDEAPLESEEEIVKPKAPKRKRAVKKEVPIGRNGLKKRKVQKTRASKDENGYRIQEDYSDWESVDGEAEEEELEKQKKPTKAPAKPKKAAVPRDDEAEEGSSSKAASKAQSDDSARAKKESKTAAASKSKAAPKEAKPKAPAKPKATASKGKTAQAGIKSFFNVAQQK